MFDLRKRAVRGSLIWIIVLALMLASSLPRAAAQVTLDTAVTMYWDYANDPDVLLNAFNEVLATDPQNVTALAYRAGVYRLLLQYDLAEADLRNALTIDPNSALALSQEGRLRVTVGGSGGMDRLVDAARRAPQDSVVLYNLGYVLNEIERPVAAIAWLTRAIDIDSSRSSYFAARAAARAQLKDAQEYDDALMAVTLDPNNYSGFYYLAHAQRFSSPSAALDAIGQAIMLNPDDASAYALRGTISLIWDQNRLAIADFDRALARRPSYTEAMRGKAVALLNLQENERAMEVLRDARPGLNTSHNDVRAARGEFYEEVGDVERALADYRETLDRQPDNPAALAGIVRIHRLRGESTLALERLNIVLQVLPDAGPALFARGQLYTSHALYDLARSDLLRASELDPTNVEVWLSLAEVNLALGNAQEALDQFTRASALLSFDGRVSNGRARAKMALGIDADVDVMSACELGVPDQLTCL